MMPTTPLLEVSGLTLEIGRRTLIHDLSMAVRPGEVWCVLGANGVGKTMLLRTLVGILQPRRGTISLSGTRLQELSASEAATQRAFLPQKLHDGFSASVVDMVLLGRHPQLSRWEWEDRDDRRQAIDALRAVGLAELAHRDIMSLSGGERQRAGIATILVQEAPLLLLDEPLAYLDLQHQILVLAHLASLAQRGKRGIMLSVHDLNLAYRFCTHALLFRDDGNADQGTVADVMNESTLSKAFHYQVARTVVGERVVFLPH